MSRARATDKKHCRFDADLGATIHVYEGAKRTCMCGDSTTPEYKIKTASRIMKDLMRADGVTPRQGPLVSGSEICRFAGVSLTKLNKLMADGAPIVRKRSVGKKYRYESTAEEMSKWMASGDFDPDEYNNAITGIGSICLAAGIERDSFHDAIKRGMPATFNKGWSALRNDIEKWRDGNAGKVD